MFEIYRAVFNGVRPSWDRRRHREKIYAEDSSWAQPQMTGQPVKI